MFFIILIIALVIFLYPLSYMWRVFKPLEKDSESFLFFKGTSSGDPIAKFMYVVICSIKVWIGNSLTLGMLTYSIIERSYAENLFLILLFIFLTLSLVYSIILISKVSRF